MIEIRGNIITYKRIVPTKEVSIDENIYDFSRKDLKKGVKKIKGVLRAVLNDQIFLPFGANGFYYQLSEDTGIKVFYSLGRMNDNSDLIEYEWNRCDLFYKIGFSVKPINIEKVKLNITINRKMINHETKGIITQRVHFPNAMWDFSLGQPYDFSCLNKDEHPLHSSSGFLLFRTNLRQCIQEKKVPEVGNKLGDIIYCQKEKRWYLVDCG
jgi:hypothetical protein